MEASTEVTLSSTSSQKPSPAIAMAEDKETLVQQSPTMVIQILAQIMTGLHFLESVGATFILWLCPALAPEPRIHQYIASLPQSPKHHHHHHHHHHHRHHSHSGNSSRRRSAVPGRASDDESGPYINRDQNTSKHGSTLTVSTGSSTSLELEDEKLETRSKTESWARMERELLAVAK